MKDPSRRQFFATVAGAAIAARGARPIAATKPMRGAFMILHTPFTADGAVDWDDLAREARFVDRCGCHGVVWPQGSSRVATLTKDDSVKRSVPTGAASVIASRAVRTSGVARGRLSVSVDPLTVIS